MSHRADQFAIALHQLDQTGDEQPIAGLFADGAELSRPELPADAAEAPAPFWSTYADQIIRFVTYYDTAAFTSPSGATNN
ncbi:hypothetical protein AB0P21_41350 [Kribbella sp. NPDC056861]|uniref:hypothetical protein n=1 Tax=Kribbella sp. NPDC056861 TaxID=3154857 RepID=UPI0034435535